MINLFTLSTFVIILLCFVDFINTIEFSLTIAPQDSKCLGEYLSGETLGN